MVDGVCYTIFCIVSFELNRAVATYYIMGSSSSSPKHCYTSVAECAGLSSDLVDLLFFRDVRLHGLDMINWFESTYSKNKES